MSKRAATTELNHENWDKPYDPEDNDDPAPTNTKADPQKLKERVILSAKRRTTPETATGGLFKNFMAFTSNTPASAHTSVEKISKSPTAEVVAPSQAGGESRNWSRRAKKLAELNSSLLVFLQDHVKQDPSCLLTPALEDYIRFAKEITGIVNLPEEDEEKEKKTAPLKGSEPVVPPAQPPVPAVNYKFSLASAPTVAVAASAKENSNHPDQEAKKKVTESPAIFSFGSKETVALEPAAVVTSAPKPFSFSFAPKEDNNGTASAAPSFSSASSFSFGMTAPTAKDGAGEKSSPPKSLFNFSSNINSMASSSTASVLPPSLFSGLNSQSSNFSFGAQPAQDADEEGEYVPPKPEVKEIKETDAVYTKRCKLYFLTDEGDWKEKGVGNLHIKPMPAVQGKKFQLLIRADTNLGNILLNIVVNKDVVFKQEKNSLRFTCIPNPPILGDKTKDPSKPCNLLVRVKDELAAKELLEQVKSNCSE